MSQDGPENLPFYSVKSFCWVNEDTAETFALLNALFLDLHFFAFFVAATSIIKAGMKDQNTVLMLKSGYVVI